MYKRLSKLLGDESGITALETAIILIAFIVVASVFAFTILSAGTFSTERGKEAIYAGLEEVSSSMVLKGNLVATAVDSDDTNVDTIYFTLATAAGSDGIDLDDTAANKVIITYRDDDDFVNSITWTPTWILHDTPNDKILEEGELVKITITLTDTYDLGTSETFALEIKPPQGAVLSVQRTTTASLDKIMDLQ